MTSFNNETEFLYCFDLKSRLSFSYPFWINSLIFSIFISMPHFSPFVYHLHLINYPLCNFLFPSKRSTMLLCWSYVWLLNISMSITPFLIMYSTICLIKFIWLPLSDSSFKNSEKASFVILESNPTILLISLLIHSPLNFSS